MARVDRSALDLALRRLRRRLRLRRALRAAAVGLLAGALLGILNIGGTAAAVSALMTAALMWAIQSIRGRQHWPDAHALLEHLNRKYPQFEESAQLLAAESSDGSAIADIQRRRVEHIWHARVSHEDWLPALEARVPALLSLLAIVVYLLTDPINALLTQKLPGPLSYRNEPGMDGLPALVSAEISVTPPAYTAMPASTTTNLDLDVIEGSRVTWSLRFSRPGEYLLELSDQPPKPLVPDGNDRFQAEAMVRTNVLYRLLHRDTDGFIQLIAVHSLRVKPDSAPLVRVLQPEETELDFPSDGRARFDTVVEIGDDFGIAGVEITASVASGAGEGVKFRDQALAFDEHAGHEREGTYTRNWDLAELGMSPGDELYFFVSARDNRSPEPNRGRSDTYIVRWLEEGTTVLAAEGIAIDFMPEYFKSQRQIIIETEQLVADRPRMEQALFDTTSRALGHDQSSLKQRYGQYLGDEAEGFGPMPETSTAREEGHEEEGHEEGGHAEGGHQENGHEGNEHGMGGHVGHAHESDQMPPADTGPATAQDLIDQFIHDHGSADIGPITRRNPVGLMKRALSNMWQAELHLMLSQPEQALPYEYEALNYLNMARQAERIYTQRLGFEPPPVTEERRLTGELDEVGDARRSEEGFDRNSDAQLFGEAYRALSRQQRGDDPTRSWLTQARDRLVQLAQDRPALLDQAALLERWLSGKPNDPGACPNCREELLATFWSLVREPLAPPEHGARTVSPDDPMTRAYARQQARRIPNEQEPSR